MRLPKITAITTTEFILKSGVAFEQQFTDFTIKYVGTDISSMTWTTAYHCVFYVSLEDISVVRTVSKRYVIRWR